MNRKEAERWICDNTKLAFWNRYTGKPHVLSNFYYLKLKSLIDEPENDNVSVLSVGSADNP